MTIVSKPATDEYRDGWDRIFGKPRDLENQWDSSREWCNPLPPDEVLYNGGPQCGMAKGPCACGSWH